MLHLIFAYSIHSKSFFLRMNTIYLNLSPDEVLIVVSFLQSPCLYFLEFRIPPYYDPLSHSLSLSSLLHEQITGTASGGGAATLAGADVAARLLQAKMIQCSKILFHKLSKSLTATFEKQKNGINPTTDRLSLAPPKHAVIDRSHTIKRNKQMSTRRGDELDIQLRTGERHTSQFRKSP